MSGTRNVHVGRSATVPLHNAAARYVQHISLWHVPPYAWTVKSPKALVLPCFNAPRFSNPKLLSTRPLYPCDRRHLGCGTLILTPCPAHWPLMQILPRFLWEGGRPCGFSHSCSPITINSHHFRETVANFLLEPHWCWISRPPPANRHRFSFPHGPQAWCLNRASQ